MFASRYGRLEVVDKLLDKGANIEATNEVTYLISSYDLFLKKLMSIYYCRMV
jgi:ankyrin repeat protein